MTTCSMWPHNFMWYVTTCSMWPHNVMWYVTTCSMWPHNVMRYVTTHLHVVCDHIMLGGTWLRSITWHMTTERYVSCNHVMLCGMRPSHIATLSGMCDVSFICVTCKQCQTFGWVMSHVWMSLVTNRYVSYHTYGMAAVSSINKIIGLFCKRDL